MAIELRQEKSTEHKIVVVRASGKLSKEDYERFVPELERLIKEQGKIRLLFEMRDFHGWEVVAVWEDIKFDLKHFADIERLALVGEKKWEEWMAKFCRPFTTAEIRYFDQSQAGEAQGWIASD
jgi:stage II sporulation SpoAA-like protein